MPTQTQCKKNASEEGRQMSLNRILHYSTPDYHGKDITVTHPNKGQLQYRFSHMAQWECLLYWQQTVLAQNFMAVS